MPVHRLLSFVYVAALVCNSTASSVFLHRRGVLNGTWRAEANEETSVAFVERLEFFNMPNAPHISLLEGARLPKVIWGIETNANPAYEKIVEAQLDTWAKDVPRQELVIVGGKFDDALVAGDSWSSHVPQNKCPDSRSGLNCKEAMLLYRGVERAEALRADWLMVGQEDKYLWTDSVQRALAHLDASKPQVLGSFGCGQGWKNHEESKGGTVPYPRGWVEPPMSCKAVYEHGGLCGGPTYYVSRAALSLLRKQGQSAEEFVAEYLALAQGDPGASDLYSSCLFYNRGIPQSTMTSATPSNFADVRDTPQLNDVRNMKKGSRGTLLAAHLSGNKAKIPELLYSLSKM